MSNSSPPRVDSIIDRIVPARGRTIIPFAAQLEFVNPEDKIAFQNYIGASSGGSSNLARGRAAVSSAATSISITFTVPFDTGSIPSIAALVEKASSGDDSIFVLGVRGLDETGFTVDLSAPAPNGNYHLQWSALVNDSIIGGLSPGDLQRGREPLASTIDSKAIVFSPALGTGIIPIVSVVVEKYSSEDDSIFVVGVREVSNTGFIADLSALTPNSNYQLLWTCITN